MGERNSPFAAGFGSHIDVIIPHWIIQARVTWRTRFSLFVFLGLILFTHTHRDPARLSFVLLPPPFSFLVCHCLFVVIIIIFLFLGKSGAFFILFLKPQQPRQHLLSSAFLHCFLLREIQRACVSLLFILLFIFSSRDNYYFVSSFSFLFSCLCVYRIVAYTAKSPGRLIRLPTQNDWGRGERLSLSTPFDFYRRNTFLV